MDYLHREKSWADDDCEVIIGLSSWDQGGEYSVKYAAKDKNGKITRQGEVPLRALPQMMHAALEFHETRG